MYISVIRKPVPMLKSTRAFCEYIIILYTTGYTPIRASICTLCVAMATFHFRRFPGFPCCLLFWAKVLPAGDAGYDVGADVDATLTSASAWASFLPLMNATHACVQRALSVAPSFYHCFLFRYAPTLSTLPSPWALAHLSGNEAVMQICWPPFRAVSSKVAQKQQAKAKAKAMHSG